MTTGFQERAGEPHTPAVRTFISPGLTRVPRHSTMTECTQDGQGDLGPQETKGCTSFDSKDKQLSAASTECTQEGQGGHGPQETQGRT